jgi:hypothetical protein
MPLEFGIVNVGKSEWLLTKLTPLSRTSANVGAVSGVTIPARSPSGTKSTMLCWIVSAKAGDALIDAARHAHEKSCFTPIFHFLLEWKSGFVTRRT